MDRTFARTLRSNQTEAEQLLWQQLRAHRFLGLKFRRQVPLGPYVVDFACIQRRLVIEVDGSQHLANAEHDARRDRWLALQGFVVLRFWNHDVMARRDEVLERVRQVVEDRC